VCRICIHVYSIYTSVCVRAPNITFMYCIYLNTRGRIEGWGGKSWFFFWSVPCKTSSVGQSAGLRGLSIPRSSFRFRQNPKNKTVNSNLHGFELRGPSSKGTKLLFQVVKAIINQSDKRGKERGGKMHLDSRLCIYIYMYDTLTSTLLFKFPFQKACQEFSLSLSLLLCSGFPPLSPQVTVTLVIGLRLRGSLQ